MEHKHRIVIVGGGAGGLELATTLGRKLGKRGRAEVVLIDRGLTHIWKPLLHEVAAGTRNASYDEISYLAQARRNGFSFQLGELETLDRESKTIGLAAIVDEDGIETIAARSIAYDTLVVSIGSVTNEFGIDGVGEHCAFLDSQQQAQTFHQDLLKLFMHVHAQPQPHALGQLHIAIIGAGATGVELAAELHEAAHQIVAYGLNNIDLEKDFAIHLIEAGDAILPALPDTISEGVTKRLKDLGVHVLTNAQISAVSQEGLHTKDGKFIRAEVKVWAAGVRGSSVLGNLDGLETNRRGQLVVDQYLRTSLDKDIFAFGDCAACLQQDGETLCPPRAQVAHQQATYLSKLLVARLDGNAPSTPYIYKDLGSLVSLSSYSTIGKLMGNLTGDVMVSGRVARWIYLSLYRMHLAVLQGTIPTTLRIFAQWLTSSHRPRLKLH